MQTDRHTHRHTKRAHARALANEFEIIWMSHGTYPMNQEIRYLSSAGVDTKCLRKGLTIGEGLTKRINERGNTCKRTSERERERVCERLRDRKFV